jgi:hypothetical protein
MCPHLIKEEFMKRKFMLMAVLAVLFFAGIANAGWIGVFEFKHFDRDGNLIWQETANNNLADEGESLFLDCVLRSTSCLPHFICVFIMTHRLRLIHWHL